MISLFFKKIRSFQGRRHKGEQGGMAPWFSYKEGPSLTLAPKVKTKIAVDKKKRHHSKNVAQK